MRPDRPDPAKQYPARCAWCGSDFSHERVERADEESVGPSWDEYFGVYECGVELDDRAVLYRDEKPRMRTWDERVQGEQTKACRTIMGLRWRTDREALERDRVDERELADVDPEAAQEKAQYEAARDLINRFYGDETWRTADGDVLKISAMDRQHRINSMAWMQRYAGDIRAYLYQAHEFVHEPGVERHMYTHELDDAAWIASLPVYAAMRRANEQDAPRSRV